MRNRSIGERPAGRRDLAGWYGAALKAQRASGLSVAEYATEIGVTATTLYQWRRRLEPAGRGGQGVTRLIEVTEARQGTEADDGDLVVHVAGGRRSVVVPHGFDGDELRRLIGKRPAGRPPTC